MKYYLLYILGVLAFFGVIAYLFKDDEKKVTELPVVIHDTIYIYAPLGINADQVKHDTVVVERWVHVRNAENVNIGGK